MRAIPHAAHNRPIWAIVASILLAGSGAMAQQPPAWKTGAAFTRQLHEIVGVTWQDRALREGLDRVSHVYGVTIFLDRRIDPDQHVDFAGRDIPLEELLRQIAAVTHAETALIGSVVYIGPRETAAQLGTIAAMRRQEISRLPNEGKARLLKTEPWKWEDLSQPKDLLRDLARQGGTSVENADVIPHDLWPAVDLPPLAWVDRMTLLLAGFGLTFQIDERGASVRLVSAPNVPVAESRQPAGQGGRTTKAQKGEKLYSLKVANEPAGNVVRTIAKSVGKELRYDADVLEKLKQRVTFDLKDATLDHLLETTLKPLGLRYRVTEKDLEIVAVQ
jgi:hypothetical protein